MCYLPVQHCCMGSFLYSRAFRFLRDLDFQERTSQKKAIPNGCLSGQNYQKVSTSFQRRAARKQGE